MPPRRLYTEVRISKFLGLLPYSAKLKFSPKWAIYSIITIGLTLLSEMYRAAVMIQDRRNNFTVDLMRTVVKLKRIGIIIIQLSKIINDRDDFEVIMRSLTDPEGKGIIHGQLVWLSLISAIIYCVPRIYEDCCRSSRILPYFVWCTNELSNIMITRQFCIIITIIKKRISNMTKIMLSPSCSPRLAESLCKQHDQYMALAIKANNFYSLQLLMTCIYISLKFLNLMVEITTIKAETEARLAILSVFANGFHAVTLMVVLLMLTGSCDNTIKEVNKFYAAVFQTMSERPHFRDNEWLSMYAEMSRKIEFTASNFFAIGYSLVTSVVAGVSTYLVIILQFNKDS